MADYSLVPVDHQPEFDHSLVPVDHDPFGADGTAAGMIAQASSQLTSQNLRDPAAFDPRTYTPTDEARQIASRQRGLGRGMFDMIRDLYTLPRRAINSAQNYSDSGEYDPGPMLEALPLGAAPAMGAEMRAGEAAFPAAKTLESRSSLMYNSPVKSPRPFEEDYPGGGIADDAGKLRFDIDGRPLVGAHISGRRVVGGGDQAISPAEYDAISEGSIGKAPQMVAPGALPRGATGSYSEKPTVSGPERSIDVLRTLQPSAAEKVTAHEMGHMLDELSGQIPTAGLSTELRRLYNTLNAGRERTTNLMGPQHLGYTGEDIPRELMAEAIRAYMADPNYIKTVARKTAARIREHVNSNPRLNRTIQFNGVAAPLAIGGGAGAFQFIPVDHDPFAEGEAP